MEDFFQTNINQCIHQVMILHSIKNSSWKPFLAMTVT